MSAETNFSVGEEILFLSKDWTWKQGVIVDLGRSTAKISWAEPGKATSHLSVATFENMRKIENQ